MNFESRIYQSLDEPEAIAAITSTDTSARDASIVPVILSGGAGSRLWPYSTEDTPKQFLSFTGAKSLFQLALERVNDRRRFASPMVVGNVRHAELCDRELAGEDGAQLVLEPTARNTAAAIAMQQLSPGIRRAKMRSCW